MAQAFNTVVITGASSGIGKALALCYARGGTVLGLLGRDAGRLAKIASECRGLGATVSIDALDVRSRADMAQWLHDFDDLTPIDLLIANAGVMAGRAADADLEDASFSHDVMEINVLGVLNSVQPILPRMLARGRGQIGIVSSIAGFIPLPDAPSYSASKAAVLNYGLGLRAAVHDSGIGVSVICPGYVNTPMMDQESGAKPFAMTAKAAADLIARGLQRNRPIIAFPFLFALITRIGGLLPDTVRRWTMRPYRFSVTARTPQKPRP
jgi:short-subunit dehydrogenase